MIANTLIVENEPYVGEDNERFLSAISDELLRAHGITGFRFTQAKSGGSALAALSDAKDKGHPYQVVLLDLHLPETDGAPPKTIDEGFKVMDYAHATGAAKCILPVSAMKQPEVMERAIRGGVVDFVPKPYTPEQLREGFLWAWRHLLLSEKDRLEQERILRLLPHVQRWWVTPLSGVFFELLRTTADAVGELRNELHERMALDFQRGSGDPIVRELMRIESGIRTTNDKWLKLTARREPENAPPPALLEDTLRKVMTELEPWRILTKATLFEVPKTVTQVDVFGDDLEVILRELLAGPLLGKDTGEPLELALSIRNEPPWVTLRLRDNCRNLADEDVNRINRGEQIEPDSKFGRAWGLSILRHTARRGAGKIEVTSLETGNEVTYQLPLA